ncbi:hypothetical protein ACFHYQ_18950 [Sphaerimonospora cavernae]|uniref:Uncharacterized protein n=1 Tax=Sphaerimonospora cavernae TaxID=1740611 RepID=A0ABV6U7D2_9ACTN
MAYQQGPQDPWQWQQTQPGQQPPFQTPYGPPSGYGYPPPQPPKKNNTALIVVVIGVVALCIFGGCSTILVLASGKPPKAVATAPVAETEPQEQPRPQEEPKEETQEQEQVADPLPAEVQRPANAGGTLTRKQPAGAQSVMAAGPASI